jgi:hypothetical protein
MFLIVAQFQSPRRGYVDPASLARDGGPDMPAEFLRLGGHRHVTTR